MDDLNDDLNRDPDPSLSGQGRQSASSTLTRKASRMSGAKSRESFIRMRSRSSMSLLSDTGEEEHRHKVGNTYFFIIIMFYLLTCHFLPLLDSFHLLTFFTQDDVTTTEKVCR